MTGSRISDLRGTARAAVRIGQRAVADAAGRTPSSAAEPWTVRVNAGIDWLCRAQDQGVDRGFSYGYTVKGGWKPSYIETTGYILGTFLWAGDVLHRPDLVRRAFEAGDWLRQVQLADGSFPNPGLDPHSGVVFDTGQDLHGLVSLAERPDGERFVAPARQAARWLIEIADDNGRWTRNTFNRIPHVYNARSAWALVRAGRLFDDPDAIKIAEANLDWACSQQQPNGWFDQCAFSTGAPPFTHTIAYTGRGLLESGTLLGNERYLQAARDVASAAARHLGTDGVLPGRIGIDDQPADPSCCLTGNAQFALNWFRQAVIDDDDEARRRGLTALRAVAPHQALTGPADVRGAIKGSHPVWGRYAPLGYPNWATKFFVDAAMLAQELPGFSP